MKLVTQILRDYETLFKFRVLIKFLVTKNQRSSLYGTVLGSAWRIIEPLTHMMLYYFLFVVIFQRGERYGVNPFILIMTGLIHFLFLQRALALCSNAIFSNSNLLLQIKIEPILLTASLFFQAFQQLLIMLALFVIPMAFYGPEPSYRLLFYPLILIAILATAWSLALLLSVLTIFVRDIAHAVPLAMRMMLYASPVIYPFSFVPEAYQSVYFCNPIGNLFALLQWSLLGLPQPPWQATAWSGVFVLASILLGHSIYNRYKPYFTKVF